MSTFTVNALILEKTFEHHIKASSTGTARPMKRRTTVKPNTAQHDSSMGGFQYSFKLSSISVCILHSDPASADSLVTQSRDYFEKMKTFSFSGLTSRRIKDLANELHSMMERDRLLLFAFPISGSGIVSDNLENNVINRKKSENDIIIRQNSKMTS